MDYNFKLAWEKFINGCDTLENMGAWDVEKNGELEAYCENILVSTLLYFVATDGKVSQVETEKFNQNFGFSYTLDDLCNITETMSSELKTFVENPREVFETLEKVSPDLASAFLFTVVLGCTTVIESDGILSQRETDALESFLQKLEALK